MPAVLSKALCTEIEALIKKAESKLVKSVRRILVVLETEGHVYRLQLPPKMVLVHRKNRDRFGVGVVDVHGLADDLVDLGFDPDLCDPICVEVTDEDVAFNKEMLEEAFGKLGSVADIAIAKFASLANSHTNFVLRVVLDELPHEGLQLICSNGAFSKSMCQSEDPCMHAHLTTGLKWRCIRKEIIEKWPCLADLIQSCQNTDATRGEHDMQMLRKIHGLITKRGGIEYEQVKSAVLRSKPKCADALQLTCMHAFYMFNHHKPKRECTL